MSVVSTKKTQSLLPFVLVGRCRPAFAGRGRVDYSESRWGGKYPVNTRATIRCNKGYRPATFISLCQTSGKWDRSFHCQGR